MSLIFLYLRSRRIGISLGMVAFLATAMFLFGTVPMAWFGTNRADLSVPLYTVIPLFCACVITLQLTNPFGDLETLSPYPLALLRSVHLLTLIIPTLVILTLALPPQVTPDASLIIIRNLLGYTGLGTLGVIGLGNRLAWLLPFVLFWVTRLNGLVPGANNTLVWAEWAWAFLPSTHLTAFVQATVLAVMGISLFVTRGSRLENSGRM